MRARRDRQASGERAVAELPERVPSAPVLAGGGHAPIWIGSVSIRPKNFGLVVAFRVVARSGCNGGAAQRPLAGRDDRAHSAEGWLRRGQGLEEPPPPGATLLHSLTLDGRVVQCSHAGRRIPIRLTVGGDRLISFANPSRSPRNSFRPRKFESPPTSQPRRPMRQRTGAVFAARYRRDGDKMSSPGG